MEPDFDPYRTWLGIPPQDQPPDYYCLLGIERFEEDRATISRASGKRLSHVSRFKNGANGRAAQKLAGELSKATSCLLNPYRKQLYDNFLRTGEPADPESGFTTAPPRERPVNPPPRKAVEPQQKESVSAAMAGRQAKRRRGSRAALWGAAFVGGAVLLAGGMAIFGGRSNREVPQDSPVASLPPASGAGNSLPEFETSLPIEDDAAQVAAERPSAPTTDPPSTAPEKPDSQEPPTESVDGPPAPVASPDTPPADVDPSKPAPAGLDGSDYNALRFTGSDFVSVSDTRGLVDLHKPFTVELWVRFSPDAVSHFLIGDAAFGSVHPDVPDGTTSGWQLWIMNSDEGRHRVAVATVQGFGTAVLARENVWRHVALCSDASQIAIFVDGRLAGRREASLLQSSFAPSPLPLHVGSHQYLHPNQPGGFQGDLRAVRISSICRYTDNFVPEEGFAADENTQVLFDFAGKSSEQIADLSGHDRRGIIHGAEWFLDESGPMGAAATAELAPSPLPVAITPAEAAKPAVLERAPVPSREEQEAAAQRLQEVLRDELAAAKTPQDRLLLADKLRNLAQESTEDLATQYMLWDEARNQAMLGMDWPKALTIVEEIAKRFKLDRWELSADTLEQATEITRAVDQRRNLAEDCLDMVTELLRGGRFELAGDVAQTSVGLATRSRDPELGRAARQLRDKVNSVKRRWNEAEQALEQLSTAPEDPELNSVYGRFLCFQQDDWNKGLPYLAKGSHASVKKAAQADLDAPSVAKQQVEVADAWYEAADSVERLDRPAVLARYLYWARQAAPELQGLAKVGVEKRMKETEMKLPTYLRNRKRDSGASPAPDRPFQPPPDFVGLLGRMQVEGRDTGVLWKYECGAAIAKPTIADVLRRIGANAGHLRLELVGILHVPTSGTVSISHRGGTENEGQSTLAVGTQIVGEVGGEGATQDVYKLELPSGEHAVRWVITGTDPGTCAIQFADSETGKPLVVYHNLAMKTTLRETPFRTRLDVNVIKNR